MIEIHEPESSTNPSEDRHSANTQTLPPPPEETMENWNEETVLPADRKVSLFGSPSSTAVIVAGVLVPAIFVCCFAGICSDRVIRLFFKHPAESSIELALALAIPVCNYLVWLSICKGDKRFAIRRGIFNGTAIGASFAAALISTIAVLGGQANDLGDGMNATFMFIGAIYWAAFAAAVYIAIRLRRSREVRSARARTILYSGFGVLLALVALIGAEARSFYLRIVEQAAVAAPKKDRPAALEQLRALDPGQDMRLECTDSRAAGLAGMFIPLKPATLRELYFAASGKPFQDNKSEDLSGYSDAYLRTHVVGAPVAGLSLVRSSMTGNVHPETLSSTINWTFVFKNSTTKPLEARAEIGVPPGAAISGMSLWSDGNERKGIFAESGGANSGWVNLNAKTPALIRDLGRGRTLVHCYPVESQEELRLRVSMAVPLKPMEETEASLALPRLIDANFNLEDENSLRLRSPATLSVKLDGVKSSKSADGAELLTGSLSENDLKGAGLTIRVKSNAPFKDVAVYDGVVSHTYLNERLVRSKTKTPSDLVVVLDSSEFVAKHFDAIKNALSAIPRSIPAYLIMGRDDRKVAEPVPMSEAISKLKIADFIGGQDNLEAVVKAAETAGETKNGAVLWIHGPQPPTHREIYPMAPYASTPAFFELSLDNGSADTSEYFKNHRDIGPFASVPRNANIADDLGSFFKKLEPGSQEYRVCFEHSSVRPTEVVAGKDQVAELLAINANAAIADSIAKGQPQFGRPFAVRYGIVTPVSSLVVMPDNSTPEAAVTSDAARSNEVAQGTVPQGAVLASLPIVRDVRSGASTTQSGGSAAPAMNGATSGTVESGDTFASGGVTTAFGVSQTAPALQGVTNGTIGPQGGDATYVSGLNTSGTVRVNNLANLEALLNVLGNGFEVLALAVGLPMLISAAMNRTALATGAPIGMTRSTKVAFALGIILIGLMVPGVMNWFVASARDANLFD